MKKSLLLILLLLPLWGHAQDKEKIKGNHQVITRLYPVKAFTRLDAGEDLKILIKKTPDTTKIQLRADENLQDVLEWSVQDSILKLWLNKKIISKKKFEITLFVPLKFEGYTLHEYARVDSEDKLDFDHFLIVLHDRSKSAVDLKIKDSLRMELYDDSSIKGDWEARKALFTARQDSEIKGILFAPFVSIDMDKGADVKLEGNVHDLEGLIGGKAELNAYKLEITQNATLHLKDKGTARLTGKKANRLTMQLEGSSSLYVKGEFKKYDLVKFEGNSALYHKE